MHLNYVIEILLSLSATQIAYFYLCFDCQPFSENIIQRSLSVLLHHAKNNLGRTYQLMLLIESKLKPAFSEETIIDADQYVS